MSAAFKNTKNPKAGTADDDRNLVLVDDDFSDADLDDKAWLMWERYKFPVLIGAGVVFAAGLAFIAWRSVRASHAEAVGEEYNTATTPELKMSFAERNQGDPLAAVAALEAADAAYAKGDYKDAANRYARATIFADAAKPRASLVSGRAAIGGAVSEIRSGDAASGVKRLTAIADAPARPAALRAHALFLLAENACGQKDFAAAKKYLDRLDRETAEAIAWNMPSGPKAALIRAFPELLAVNTSAAAPAKTNP